jgi:hypothetical protein
MEEGLAGPPARIAVFWRPENVSFSGFLLAAQRLFPAFTPRGCCRGAFLFKIVMWQQGTDNKQ